jgi:sarcosine oxidase subunit alpha
VDRRLANIGGNVSRGRPVTIEFEGETHRAFAGEPLAVALFASGVSVLSRSIKYHRPRAFFCLSGHCGACLLRVDGVPNLRACRVPCRDGLVAAGQNAFPASDLDVLGAVDWLFPKGMDHHTLMIGLSGIRPLNAVMQKVVRQLSGLGTLPDRPAADLPPVTERAVDLAVIGGGPAGLAAATAAARAGARVVLLDEDEHFGGSLLCQPGAGPAEAARRAAEAAAAGVELVPSAALLAAYPDEELLAVATPGGLVRLRPRRTVYATGGYDVLAPFADNDRPGVFSARAVGTLLVRHGVLPGQRVVIAEHDGDAAYAAALATALAAVGVEAVRVAEPLAAAHGGQWVNGVETADGVRHACDAVAVAARPSPASEAARSHGAAVQLSVAAGGFAVTVDDDGRTSVPGVFAAGDVTGFRGPTAAAEHGARVGRAAAAHV